MEDNPKGLPDSQDKLRKENELRKAKLSLEQGAIFHQPDDGTSIPPDLEKNFLDHVEMFDKAYAKGKRITVFERIGEPTFITPALLAVEKTETELDRLMQLMVENGICLETLCDVEPEEIYRFITEELFLQDLDDIRIPGMMSVFTYEEFHPNHEYDLQRYSEEFIHDLFNFDNDSYFKETYSGMKDEKKLHLFREAYSEFSSSSSAIKSIDYDETTAWVIADISVVGHLENQIIKHLIQGECKLIYTFNYGYWYVDEFSLPPTQTLK